MDNLSFVIHILTFVANIVGSVAWPAALVGILYVFRKELRNLLPLVKNIKVAGVEVDLKSLEFKLENIDSKVDAVVGAVQAAKTDYVEPAVGDVSPEPPRLVIDADEKKVLLALAKSDYKIRSQGGIARDVGISKEAVEDLLLSLQQKELVNGSMSISDTGYVSGRWKLTPQGRSIAEWASSRDNSWRPV